MTTLGIDTSNYTGELTVAELSKLRNSFGTDRAIIACEFPNVFRNHVQVCQAAGYNYEAYIYLYNSSDYTAQVLQALQTIAGSGASRLWLDIEDTSAPLPTESIIRAALAAAAAFPVGIYTGNWYWTGYIGNPQVGDAAPLWVANYDNNPDDFRVWFGGWTEALVKQYAGDVHQDLLQLDLDSWRE